MSMHLDYNGLIFSSIFILENQVTTKGESLFHVKKKGGDWVFQWNGLNVHVLSKSFLNNT
jgi:hypothetical protein